MPDTHASPRLDGLRALLDVETPALSISSGVNICYLLGRPTLFDPDFGGTLLVTETATVLMVDSRYIGVAEAANLPCRVELVKVSPWASLAAEVKKAKLKRLGFEAAYTSVSKWQQLKKHVLVELAPVIGLVEQLRVKKDESEITCLNRAAAIADSVFNELLNLIKPGMSERDIASEIDYRLRRAGAERSSFETIVAGGPNSAFPHARAGARKVKLGDMIKIDFGAVCEGYHSDMTRTVFLGKAGNEQKDIYKSVAKAQVKALEGLAPGITGKEADALARNFFKNIGKVRHFGHNLGHGVGLDVHEQPALGPKSEARLEVGMVFTVEPGLYFPGFGGVRIEDMVVMREHGIQILTTGTKELVEL